METRQISQLIKEVQESWISGHLYYHQGLDPVVQGFVHPLVVSLANSGQIDAFFFVRYGLGGAHIRLRLRAVQGAKESALQLMQQSARRFLELTPSTRPVDEEAIHRTNKSILAFDSNENDDSIYPDNSFQVVPFCPEVERYGGPDRFQISLDFFTLSSVAAVEFLSQYGDTPRQAQLAQAYSLLLQQALGFAANEVELVDLLGYGVDSWGGGPPKIIEKGDRVFRSQTDGFLQLFRRSIQAVHSMRATREPSGGASGFLAMGAEGLSAAIETADRMTRARIGGSQLHMTSTRLGLSNVEEVYISRLLTMTLREVLATNGENFSWLEEKMAGKTKRAEDPREFLGRLLSPALATLADFPQNQRLLA